MPSIAVVILNWNGIGFMKKFIPGVVSSCKRLGEARPGWSARTIIADNGSTDGSVEWMKTLGEDVGTLFFDKNHGFTGGYNKAFRELGGTGFRANDTGDNAPCGEYDYFLLLNSDIEVTGDWLIPLAEWMETHPSCGIASPKLRSHGKRSEFEYAGAAGGFIDRWGFPFCRGRVMSDIETDNGQYDRPCMTFWATGAAMMARREVYRQCGGLDEAFFAHMEEIDLCWRAQLLGWQVWNVPQSTVFHVGGGALPNESPRKLYLNFRNNLFMLHKNLPARKRGLFIFFRMLLDGAAGAVYLLKGKGKYCKSVIEAHRDFRRMKNGLAISPHRPAEELAKAGITDRNGRLRTVWHGSILLPFGNRKRFFRGLETAACCPSEGK